VCVCVVEGVAGMRTTSPFPRRWIVCGVVVSLEGVMIESRRKAK